MHTTKGFRPITQNHSKKRTEVRPIITYAPVQCWSDALSSAQSHHGIDEVKIRQLPVQALDPHVHPIDNIRADFEVDGCLDRSTAAREVSGRNN